MTATHVASKTISAGARYYGAVTLPLYDAAVLKTVVPYAWNCPLATEQALYDSCVSQSRNHLDVGVASGYFLQHAAWNKKDDERKPALTLMDLNPKATKYAAHRLQKTGHFSSIQEITGDALKPFPVPINETFDSIGLFHLLHCIPGDLPTKSAVLKNAGNGLSKDGVVFGANVTPMDCEQQNMFAKGVLALSHSLGALNNQQDSHADMEKVLDTLFYDYKVERIGCMSLWQARNPKF